jgi:hypothetical protein
MVLHPLDWWTWTYAMRYVRRGKVRLHNLFDLFNPAPSRQFWAYCRRRAEDKMAEERADRRPT